MWRGKVARQVVTARLVPILHYATDFVGFGDQLGAEEGPISIDISFNVVSIFKFDCFATN